ncbi:MAG TPA: nucleoside transporter C-terminal domain-containing protein [Burkholderiaceae bacterium]|nr:nucleoside transporter C-terminal domain-containing protein [Burkholderiaceae bacterium]
MQTLQSAFGLIALLALAWLSSEDRATIPWRLVASGMALAFVLAAALLKLPPLAAALASLNSALDVFENATKAGTAFVFGYLGGGQPPFEVSNAAATFVLAFRALPMVLLVAALSALLFHWGVLPLIVRAFAWVLKRTMGIGGSVGVSAAANVFVGMVEAPLVIAPYLARLSRGELFIVMNCGMATIAGTVLVLYATFLTPVVPNALGHLLVASIVATPVAIVVAALIVPPRLTDDASIDFVRQDANAVAALTRGTLEGLQLLLNIVAMLVVFVALVALANAGLALLPDLGGAPATLERIFGWLFAPLAWLFGVPAAESLTAGALLGKKTVLNEFIAYLDLVQLPPEALSARSRLLLTYALCGFANFGSLGIMLGGLNVLLPPDRHAEIAELGLRSIWAGLLATCTTAAIVGVLV